MTDKVRWIVPAVGALILLGAIAWAPHKEPLAFEPGRGAESQPIGNELGANGPSPVRHRVAECQPIGDEVGWNGLPRRIRHVSTGIVLVLIPPGRFTMGSPASEAKRDRDEEQRAVVIRSAFYLGETEVTIAQWRRIMRTLPKQILHRDPAELPVGGVSWHQAKEFVHRLNTRGGESGWRLPTEAEWEYACRAGTATPFSFGDNISTSQVNYNGRRPYNGGALELPILRDQPMPVRSLPPNRWGLYEMHGNVWEWCEDQYVVHPTDDAGKSDSPVSSGSSRVLRGGAYTSKAKQTRSAYRDGYPPSSSGPKYGFRVVKSIAR